MISSANSLWSTTATFSQPTWGVREPQNPTGSSASTAETPREKGKEETPKEKESLEKLQARDREVRRHEQAHLAAAGQYARGGASFEYESGPDGKRYAVGGEVPIDISEGRTPEETVQKAEMIRRAALAPADPSSQDRGVAAKAAEMQAEAAKEIAQKNGSANEGEVGDGESETTNGNLEGGEEQARRLEQAKTDTGIIRPNPKTVSRAYQNNTGPQSSPNDAPISAVATLAIAI